MGTQSHIVMVFKAEGCDNMFAQFKVNGKPWLGMDEGGQLLNGQAN